jgi:hypothetical protein
MVGSKGEQKIPQNIASRGEMKGNEVLRFYVIFSISYTELKPGSENDPEAKNMIF